MLLPGFFQVMLLPSAITGLIIEQIHSYHVFIKGGIVIIQANIVWEIKPTYSTPATGRVYLLLTSGGSVYSTSGSVRASGGSGIAMTVPDYDLKTQGLSGSLSLISSVPSNACEKSMALNMGDESGWPHSQV